MSMVIVNNFLKKEDFKKLQDTVLGSWFPWYFNNGVTDIDEENSKLYDFQFTHTFYSEGKVTSNWFHLLKETIEQLNPKELLRIKANFLTISKEQMIFDLHTDVAENVNGKTAILYMNTNNGFTIFEDGTKISSIENRLVIFNSNILHTGTTCTDKKTRCVINFNYTEQL